MAPPAAAPVAPSAAEYYGAVAPVLLRHLRGRPVLALGHDLGRPEPGPAPQSPEQLLSLVSAGVIGFLTSPAHRIALHLIPGDGADIATAATAALQLAEQCAADGLLAVPLTDGAQGLWLLAPTDGDVAAAAGRYTDGLTGAAPELATTDPAQADGRTLIELHTDASRWDVPAPYTLLAGPLGRPAVIPLHLDEIAAITAGMPAELAAGDVAARVAARGDLASALIGAPAA